MNASDRSVCPYSDGVSNRTEKLQKTFGAAVRAEREAKALTQEKLAEKADLSLNFIGNVERGEKMASLETIVRVAEALKLTRAELLAKAKIEFAASGTHFRRPLHQNHLSLPKHLCSPHRQNW